MADELQKNTGALPRMAAVGIIVLAVAGGFAYLGGWLTPGDVTPAKFTDAFEKVDGLHPGFRRNHAKGVCVSGFFESNGQGVRLSKGLVFQPGRISVVGRFSLSGGNPFVMDAADTVRGLGLLFKLPDGEEWRTAMVNLPVFPVNTPQSFYDRMVALEPDPDTHKVDPEKMKTYLAAHPETLTAIQIIKSHPPSSGFENTAFNSLNAFRFVNSSGVSTSVRWIMQPLQPIEPASATQPAQDDKNYLFDALIAAIQQHPLKWNLIVTIAQTTDPTSDATLPWPPEREQVNVGTLTLDTIESEETSATRDINFDPLVLPDGIEPSDDPLLSARSAVYSQSFTRRAGEAKSPSAITPADIRK